MRGCSLGDVPCHRVVAAAGRLGGFGGYLELKRSLLRAEGVLVSGSRIRDFTDRRVGSRAKAQLGASARKKSPARTRPRSKP
jgi:alkylated DNA nucleotide flippase Atl1